MKITDKIAKVDGFLTNREATILHKLASQARKSGGVIAEVGSWKGKSTICLATGSQENHKIKVYAIDHHVGSEEHQKDGKIWTFEEFKKNIKDAKVEDVVLPVLKTSEDAAKDFDQPIELIFIDGDHSYEGVKRDFELWYPKVVEGGVIAFHDTVGWDGPRRLVNEEIFKGKNFKNARFSGSITYATKVSKTTNGDRIKNRGNLALKRIAEVTNSWKIPGPIRSLGGRIVGIIQR